MWEKPPLKRDKKNPRDDKYSTNTKRKVQWVSQRLITEHINTTRPNPQMVTNNDPKYQHF